MADSGDNLGNIADTVRRISERAQETISNMVDNVSGMISGTSDWLDGLHQSAKAAGDADYPAYGVTGPSTKSSTVTNGDRKLAQSAQMYHYQHQKQQMIAMENRANGEMKQDNSDDDSEEENEEGDYTVYECPGLAPAGEMTVKNPLFNDDHDPSSPPPTKDGDN
ncbi:neural proliferation differentiation and control protein 1-like [Saccoglossus kowalevskii]|uniref:Neural proliferation differentiation and control protein 1-like isoform X1 n=1 Tax=Saccoglossus kowalevskii TaxID=10224 RepID=A0ABM0MY88_SACKO|nr:PREDICTED: neural proliferation differentiation and control protein 1-like isoform X1 [Saccoglossus kowalevskii]